MSYQMTITRSVGPELILDLHECNIHLFTRRALEVYFINLCDIIEMERCEIHFWDDLETPESEKQTSPHTKGTSAIQFILTSNITVHTLDILGKVFVNIFSCKDFDADVAVKFTELFFNGKIANQKVIDRL